MTNPTPARQHAPAPFPSCPAEAGPGAGRSYSTSELGRLYADHLRFADSVIHLMLKGFPQDRWHVQSTPNDNHILWILGHLAGTNDWFSAMLDGGARRFPEKYKPVFGFGSKPEPDAARYPPAPEVLEMYTQSLTRLIGAIEGCRDFDGAPESDSGGFVKNKHEIATRASFHLGWHIGHMSSLRRALGLPSAFS